MNRYRLKKIEYLGDGSVEYRLQRRNKIFFWEDVDIFINEVPALRTLRLLNNIKIEYIYE